MKHYLTQATLIGLSAFLLAACTSETPVDGDRQDKKDLVVSAEIVSSVTGSKAVGAPANAYDKRSFVEGDPIRITIGDVYKIYKKQNMQWLPESESLTVDGTSKTITAVYPHDFSTILADQADGDANTGTNFMKSNKLMSEITTASNYVKFKFAPAFTKITITVAYKSDSKRKNVTATLTGNGLCTNDNSNETIKMLRTSSNADALMNHAFTCILNPGTQRRFVLTVSGLKNDGSPAENETYTQAAKEFKPGYNYIYNFSSNDNLILNSVTVEPFGKGGTSDVGSAT